MRNPAHALFALTAMLLCGCAGSSEPTSRKDLEREFQAEFGFPPSQQVLDLRCKTVRVQDTWGKWMLFTLDDSTVQAIATNGFIAASSDLLARPWENLWTQDMMATSPNPNAPKWWREPGSKKVRVYYKQGHPADYAGYRYFWIDDESKQVYAKSAAWH